MLINYDSTNKFLISLGISLILLALMIQAYLPLILIQEIDKMNQVKSEQTLIEEGFNEEYINGYYGVFVSKMEFLNAERSNAHIVSLISLIGGFIFFVIGILKSRKKWK